MLIRLGYDIRFETSAPLAIVAMLRVHPSRVPDLKEPDRLVTEPDLEVDEYVDSFGNICSRFLCPVGTVRLMGSTLIEDSGLPDEAGPNACQHPVEELPSEVLQFLLNSRYCEVDLLSHTATELFGHTPLGWARAQAIRDWVYSKVRFGYNFARPTRTALDTYTERVGVCRDFQHLAVTLTRAMNIPARYVAGYLGDIGVPVSPDPMDFSAWYEVFLDGRWWTMDARHNRARIGRVLVATGRDAADVAITTSFGTATLVGFQVVTEEVSQTVAVPKVLAQGVA